MKLLDDFRFWLGKRVMGKTVARLEPAHDETQCEHVWALEGSFRRKCLVCGDLQTRAFKKYGDVRYEWVTILKNSNRSFLP